MAVDARLQAAIALTRFGLGARPGEMDTVAFDPAGWLTAQIADDTALLPGAAPTGREALIALADYQEVARESRNPTDGEPPEAAVERRRRARRALGAKTRDAFRDRLIHAADTPHGFAERWAAFWANTFTVSSQKFQVAALHDSYEREAIRPHVFGRFEDLLVAAESHPAMLVYLDQAGSIGPDSPAGRRRRERSQAAGGLNENLAREILELHTLGADGGYTQTDVTEFAHALTGWSIPPQRQRATATRGRDTGFLFRAAAHQPGPRTILGTTYEQDGRDQGLAVLRDLAAHPATARRAAHRIAAHFVADQPPAALVDRLEQAWTRSGGDLAEVARALVTAPEAWAATPAKFKTPHDFIVSAHRAAGVRPDASTRMRATLIGLGQPPASPPSPEGWPDDAGAWATPDALIKRLDWSAAFAEAHAQADPIVLAEATLGPRLTPITRTAVSRAEDRAEAFALLLMSPEFQRR